MTKEQLTEANDLLLKINELESIDSFLINTSCDDKSETIISFMKNIKYKYFDKEIHKLMVATIRNFVDTKLPELNKKFEQI